jgi:hypothetical protein
VDLINQCTIVLFKINRYKNAISTFRRFNPGKANMNIVLGGQEIKRKIVLEHQLVICTIIGITSRRQLSNKILRAVLLIGFSRVARQITQETATSSLATKTRLEVFGVFRPLQTDSRHRRKTSRRRHFNSTKDGLGQDGEGRLKTDEFIMSNKELG